IDETFSFSAFLRLADLSLQQLPPRRRHRSDAIGQTPPLHAAGQKPTLTRRRSPLRFLSPVRSYVVQSPLLGAPTQAFVLVLRSLQ
ncbi:hypothetical protein LINPERHAP2_LOCUS7505, partial [Linum perenne]